MDPNADSVQQPVVRKSKQQKKQEKCVPLLQTMRLS